MLPGPGLPGLVALEGREAGGERAGIAGGPQPHVGVVQHALRGRRRHRRDEPLRQAGEILRGRQRPLARRVLGVALDLVEQDEIEVGRHRHLAARHLAEGQQRHRRPRHHAVALFELDAHRREQALQQRLGQGGELLARLPRRQRAGEQPGRDQELLLLADDAGAVDHLLVVAGIAQKALDLGDQRRTAADDVGEGRIDQRIHDMGAVDHRVGHARRRGEKLHQQRAQLLVVAQQGEELHARRQARQEVVEAPEGEIGIAGLADGGQQRRQQLGEMGARGGDGGGAIAAIVPFADGRRHRRGILESHSGQRLERRRIVVAAGEHQIAAGGAQRFALGEELGIIALHGSQRGAVVGLEARAVGIAHQPADDGDALGGVGHHMGLLVAQHLQPVLDRAQEPVGGGELGRRPVADPALARQRRQRLGRRPHAQAAVAAAGDQLLGLGEELDLADAAAPELDVVALDPRLADILRDVDLALHRLDVGDGGEVEMLAPDIGGELGQEGLPCPLVAGAGPRLDPGGALPVLAAALVVGEGGVGGDGDRGRARIGAQPEIGAEHVIVADTVLQQRRQPLHDARIDLGGVFGVGQHAGVAVEEGDDIDVGGIIELAPAMLAEREDGEAAGGGGGRDQVALVDGALQQHGEAGVERRVGEVGQRRGRLRRRPEAAGLRRRREERDAALGAAQGVADRRFIRAGVRRGGAEGIEALPQGKIGVGQSGGQPGAVPLVQFPEIRGRVQKLREGHGHGGQGLAAAARRGKPGPLAIPLTRLGNIE